MDFYETSACSNLNIKEVRGKGGDWGDWEGRPGGSPSSPCPLLSTVLHAADGAGAAGASQGAGGAAGPPPRPPLGTAGGERAAAPGGRGEPQNLLVLKAGTPPPAPHTELGWGDTAGAGLGQPPRRWGQGSEYLGVTQDPHPRMAGARQALQGCSPPRLPRSVQGGVAGGRVLWVLCAHPVPVGPPLVLHTHSLQNKGDAGGAQWLLDWGGCGVV